MFEHNTAGYDLLWENTNEWIFVVKNKEAFSGTFPEVVALMVKKGFPFSGIEFGINMMLECGHNGIHFGLYKSPIFTFKKEERKIA